MAVEFSVRSLWTGQSNGECFWTEFFEPADVLCQVKSEPISAVCAQEASASRVKFVAPVGDTFPLIDFSAEHTLKVVTWR